MVTYFNRKDLVNFGEYLLSDERAEMILQSAKELNHTLDIIRDIQQSVSHADIENWIEKNKKE